jgi:hypothetical protein
MKGERGRIVSWERHMAPPWELSDDAEDKLKACLNQCWTRSRDISGRTYFVACARWWSELTPKQQEASIAVIDAYRLAHFTTAAKRAAVLPSAPKYPL